MARLMAWLTRAGLALVALVLAHNVVFLATYGPHYGEALVRTGHDDAWTTAFAVGLGIGLAILIAGIWQLRRLALLARVDGIGAGSPDPGLGAFARHFGRLWLGLAPATAVLFVVQENVELLAARDELPGLGVLAHHGTPLAATVIGAVTMGVALVCALYRWRRDILVARVAAGAGRWHRAAAELPRPPRADRGASLALRGSIAGRAPPMGSRIQA
jgi:hypothetical protein